MRSQFYNEHLLYFSLSVAFCTGCCYTVSIHLSLEIKWRYVLFQATIIYKYRDGLPNQKRLLQESGVYHCTKDSSSNKLTGMNISFHIANYEPTNSLANGHLHGKLMEKSTVDTRLSEQLCDITISTLFGYVN